MIIVVKGLLVSGLVLVFGYPVHTALLTGIALAQSAEFSFLLVGRGTDLGAITSATFSLLLAGVAASIILAPSLHAVAEPLASWLEARLPESALARLPQAEDTTPVLRGHAVICGYGRVGQLIGEALGRRSFPFVVIEQNQRLVQQLRTQHIPTLFGRADNLVLLERANLAQARILTIAIPDPLTVRRIVDYAQQLNPQLDIVARAHSPVEHAFLRSRNVAEPVMGELEIALEMTRAALNRFGVGTLEIQAFLQRMRTQVQEDGAVPPRQTRNQAE
jgi:CPA2 family monovalent cation:H+ antiporter-2